VAAPTGAAAAVAPSASGIRAINERTNILDLQKLRTTSEVQHRTAPMVQPFRTTRGG
jgi:hypothetical protein